MFTKGFIYHNKEFRSLRDCLHFINNCAKKVYQTKTKIDGFPISVTSVYKVKKLYHIDIGDALDKRIECCIKRRLHWLRKQYRMSDKVVLTDKVILRLYTMLNMQDWSDLYKLEDMIESVG